MGGRAIADSKWQIQDGGGTRAIADSKLKIQGRRGQEADLKFKMADSK
jgi:hypothetical protein